MAPADPDHGDVVGGKARAFQNVVRDHVRRRPRSRDADAAALEFLHVLEIRHGLAVHGEDALRGAALEHEGAHRLTLRLHRERVLKSARNHVGGAAHDGLQRFRAALEVDDLHVEAFFLVEALPFGDGGGEIVVEVLPAHGDRDFGLFGFGREDRGGGHARGKEGRAAAEGASGEGSRENRLVSAVRHDGHPCRSFGSHVVARSSNEGPSRLEYARMG